MKTLLKKSEILHVKNLLNNTLPGPPEIGTASGWHVDPYVYPVWTWIFRRSRGASVIWLRSFGSSTGQPFFTIPRKKRLPCNTIETPNKADLRNRRILISEISYLYWLFLWSLYRKNLINFLEITSSDTFHGKIYLWNFWENSSENFHGKFVIHFFLGNFFIIFFVIWHRVFFLADLECVIHSRFTPQSLYQYQLCICPGCGRFTNFSKFPKLPKLLTSKKKDELVQLQNFFRHASENSDQFFGTNLLEINVGYYQQ